MAKKYKIEREGQIDFFDNYGIDYEGDNSILVDNTDGVYNGCLFEFKLKINDINKVLFQAIKYLSRMRIKGESVPATILLVDLNGQKIYIFDSIDYIKDIQKVYIGEASKNNEGFSYKKIKETINYADMSGSSKVRNILKKEKKENEKYIPIDIDENCIVGWAERYYREKPKATKGDFIGDDTGSKVRLKGEIREPKHFKYLINPYVGKTNEKFKYLMDCLNDRLRKKDLGAFYTPMEYAKVSAEMVLKAVENIPKGNDYIILDRCAGTGNLEEALIGLKDKKGDLLISHCVVSTYEYYEYKVLNERLGDKVREIIPPSEADVVYENGSVSNADALSSAYFKNPIIKKFVENKKCSIILFENPPYRDASAGNKTNDSNSKTYKSYIFEKMSEVKDTFKNPNISTVRNLNNQFVWSGFNYYIRQEGDSYILFSPVAWWKECGFAYNKCIAGYLFNRTFFHAGESPIMCVWWSDKIDKKQETITLKAMKSIYDLKDIEKVVVRKCNKTFTPFFEKNINGSQNGIFCEGSGEEVKNRKCDGISIYNPDVIAYLNVIGFSLDPMHINLVRYTYFGNRGTYVTKNNFTYLLPLFVAKEYPREEFYEKGEGCIYFTTSDGGTKYRKDNTFIKSCLIYTCLSNQNKCLSFKGSDKREYQNELCFDKGSLCSKYLKDMKLNKAETELIDLWNKILKQAKKTKKYKEKWQYGVYQIDKELNTFKIIETRSKKEIIYDYPELNGNLDTLRTKLKEYYKKCIKEKMFEYELLK